MIRRIAFALIVTWLVAMWLWLGWKAFRGVLIYFVILAGGIWLFLLYVHVQVFMAMVPVRTWQTLRRIEDQRAGR